MYLLGDDFTSGDLNLFTYVINNPLSYIDFLGKIRGGNTSIDWAIQQAILRGDVKQLDQLFKLLAHGYKKEQQRRLRQICKINKKNIKTGTLDKKAAEKSLINEMKRWERARDVGREGKTKKLADFLDWLQDFLD